MLPNLAKCLYALPIEQHHETEKINLMGIDPLGNVIPLGIGTMV